MDRVPPPGRMPRMALADMRKDYGLAGLTEKDLAKDPFRQFERWFQEAGAAKLVEPNACVLATAARDGRPRARVMLLKAVLDREVAPGASTLTEEAIVLPLATVRRASDALLSDLPTTHALMTIAGDAVEHTFLTFQMELVFKHFEYYLQLIKD